MESAAENSRSVDRRTPADRTQPRSWISRMALVGALILLVYFVWSLPEQYGRMQLAQAETQFKAEKYDEALASLDSASRYLPKVPGIFIVKAQIYSKMGNKKAAEENLLKALPLLGDSRNELLLFVNWAGKLGLGDAVVEACDKIDAVAPKHPMEDQRELLNGSAYSRAVVNRDCEKGLKAIDRALSLPEGMPSLTVAGFDRAMFEDTRALLLHRMARDEEALTEINNALAYVEKNVGVDLVKSTPEPAAAKAPQPKSETAKESATAQETAASENSADNSSAGSSSPENAAPGVKVTESAKKTGSDTDAVFKEGPFRGMAKKQVVETWATMLNHRQMIREALGDSAGAELDRKRILELGHTPGEELH